MIYRETTRQINIVALLALLADLLAPPDISSRPDRVGREIPLWLVDAAVRRD